MARNNYQYEKRQRDLNKKKKKEEKKQKKLNKDRDETLPSDEPDESPGETETSEDAL